MGGGPTVEPFVMAPMLGILGDNSFGSEGEGAGGGGTSSPREGEAASAVRRRPSAALVEVSEDEAEVSSLAAPFQSMAFWASSHHAEDVVASYAIPSPLHLGELPFNFVFLAVCIFSFIGT